MCLLNQFFLVLSVCLLSLVGGQGVPSIPCPKIFGYYKQTNGDVYGSITIPYDGSSTLILGVNASMQGYYDSKTGLQIKLDTPGRDLIEQRAKTLRYSVYFPFQQTIPKITNIMLNNRGYCSGPPEETIPGGPGVTSMWSEHKYFFQTSNRNSGFQPSKPVYQLENIPTSPVYSVDDIPPSHIYPDKEVFLNPVYPDKDSASNAVYPNTVVSSSPAYPVENTEQPVIANQRYPEVIFTNPPTNKPAETFNKPTGTTSGPHLGCGIPRNTIVPLILGGTDISNGMFPWLSAMFVAKGSAYEYKCTANLISEKHVLTAARCVNYYKVQIVQTDQILFIFGKINLHNWATNGAVARGALKIQTNPEYNQVSGHGDVSIITLDSPIKFSHTISPICLWSGNNDFTDIVGKIGTVAGWGADEEAQNTGHFSVSVAKSIEMPVVSNEECLNSNLTYYSLTSDMTFCAGRRDGSGPCVGDNGAAFMMVKQGKYYLRGLASLTLNGSDGKCDLSYYTIFCDVAKVVTWIETYMKE